MCGICGLVSRENGVPPDPQVLAAMSRRLAHRGPDSEGAFRQGPAALAARRLSIIDLEGGDQPIGNEDGSVTVVQNGEIYNYRELRRDLERAGHRFATHSDTEVLVHLYEEHGPGFVELLRGMFALAIWDAPAARLILARDPFGIKPLYYSLADGNLSFASELKAMLEQPGFSREIDPRAVAAYLAFNSIPAPLTIFAAARKLPAGTILSWQNGAVSETRYARPAPAPADRVTAGPASELASELLDTLRDSVAAHLVADVPVGVLLSGGVDSAAITALAATQQSDPVKTFSVGFEESSFDELEKARLVAERYGTDHHEIVLRPDAVELLPLSGEGADELFGGYYTYVADLLAARVGRLAALAAPLVEALPSSDAKVSFDYRAKRFVRAARLAPLERHHAWKEIFSADQRQALLGGGAPAWDPVDIYRERYAETAGAEPLARLQDVDLGIYLVDDLLVKTDRSSMAHSLELRVPFLDRRVADLALGLATPLKVRGTAKKRLLRRALAPLLPREILRGPKQGFSIPLAAWLRGPLQGYARDVLSPATLARQGCLDPAMAGRLLERHCSGREDLSRQLWGLLAFTLWFDRYVAR